MGGQMTSPAFVGRARELTVLDQALQQADGGADRPRVAVRRAAAREGGFDITAFSWVGGPFAISGSRDIYVTGGGGNYGRFSDPEVDALFEQATAELDPARSTALANQIDRKLWEGLPVIPLYQRPTFLAWRDTLRNVVENPSNEGPLWNAESSAFAADAP